MSSRMTKAERERKQGLLDSATGATFKPGGEMYFDRLLSAYAVCENLESNENVNDWSVAQNIVLKHPITLKGGADDAGPLFVDVQKALQAAEARGRALGLAERATMPPRAGGRKNEHATTRSKTRH